MLNGKTISGKHIIYRAIRDADLKQPDFDIGTMLEWLGESLDLIGCPYSYIQKVGCIEIVDHKGTLPCDLVEINQASTLMPSGLQIPMRTATSTFHPLHLPQGAEVGFINYQQPTSVDENGNLVFDFFNFPTEVSGKNVALLPTGFTDVQYTVNDNYIFTSYQDGAKVLLSYKAFPVDTDGFPMIPDNEKFKSYCTWHLLMKVYYRQYIKGKVSREVFSHAEQQRDFYAGAATTAGIMPTIDMMESWKGMYLHLIPRLNEQSNFFHNLGDQEMLREGKGWNRY